MLLLNRGMGLLWVLLALLPAPAPAQTQDATITGPVHLVVGYPAGGSTDRIARIVGDKLQARLGVAVLVDNKPGAGGRLAAQQVKLTKANQTVLMLANPAVMVIGPLVLDDAGYDAERDFVPLSLVNDYEYAMAVGSQVPVKAFSHLLAWLRANPERANFGVPALGSLPHYFALMLGEQVQLRPEVIGYRGTAPLLNELIGGQIPVAIDTLDGMLAQHQAGRLRILATLGDKRSPFAPLVPTLQELGLPVVATGWNAFFAPASMPRERQDRLGQLLVDIMQDPDTRRKFAEASLVPVVNTPAQTAAAIARYRAQWAPVVRRADLRP